MTEASVAATKAPASLPVEFVMWQQQKNELPRREAALKAAGTGAGTKRKEAEPSTSDSEDSSDESKDSSKDKDECGTQPKKAKTEPSSANADGGQPKADTSTDAGSSHHYGGSGTPMVVKCYCDDGAKDAARRRVNKAESENVGRWFHVCIDDECGYWQWETNETLNEKRARLLAVRCKCDGFRRVQPMNLKGSSLPSKLRYFCKWCKHSEQVKAPKWETVC